MATTDADDPIQDDIAAQLLAIEAEEEQQEQRRQEAEAHQASLRKLTPLWDAIHDTLKELGRCPSFWPPNEPYATVLPDIARRLTKQLPLFVKMLAKEGYLDRINNWPAYNTEGERLKGMLLDNWSRAKILQFLRLMVKRNQGGHLRQLWGNMTFCLESVQPPKIEPVPPEIVVRLPLPSGKTQPDKTPLAPVQPAAVLKSPSGSDDETMSLVRIAEVWHLRYLTEKGDYPVNGNRFIGWLAKLLSKPNHPWTVAELYGDPDGKLAADALMGGECAKDKDGIHAIWKRIEEINEIVNTTGGSEELENEHETLLKKVEGHSGRDRMKAAASDAYNNITTQKRQFLTKLKQEMPQLTLHLRNYINQFAGDYTISYRPPSNTPSWKI